MLKSPKVDDERGMLHNKNLPKNHNNNKKKTQKKGHLQNLPYVFVVRGALNGFKS